MSKTSLKFPNLVKKDSFAHYSFPYSFTHKRYLYIYPTGFQVQVIRLSEFILNKVASRKLPNLPQDHVFYGAKPKVIMKIDVEGSEVELVPDLILSGAMSYVDLSFIEWHARLTDGRRKELALKVIKN